LASNLTSRFQSREKILQNKIQNILSDLEPNGGAPPEPKKISYESEVVDRNIEPVDEAEVQTNEQRFPICKSLMELIASHGVDVKKSAYFSNTKQVVSGGDQSGRFFKETSPFLPEGWRFRTFEFKDKRGGVVIQKQYISPANIIIKSNVGVVEYLRLEGKQSLKEIIDVAKWLKISFKRLKKLFTDDDRSIFLEDFSR